MTSGRDDHRGSISGRGSGHSFRRREQFVWNTLMQGIEPVYLSICFLLKTPNSSKVNNIPFVKLTEGKMVKAREANALTIEELTVKMELLEPEIS